VSERVRLTATLTAAADKVEVAYKVVNGSDRAVYLIDGGFRASKGGAEWTDRLRVSFEPPATVVFSSVLPPLDPTVLRAVPPSTYAAKIEAGAEYAGKLSAPVPVTTHDAEAPPGPVFVVGSKLPSIASPPAVREVVCRTARFELGAIPDDPSLQAKPVELGGRPVWHLSASAWRLQQVLTADLAPVSLTVRVPAALVRETR